MTLTYGSLFTGVGGFDLGFDQAGYDCRWQVEWDKHCQQTLAYHWPNVPRHHDVCDVNGATLQPVDVITYGSPCQDLSVAGKRAGIEGGRSGMFFEAVRIFKEMRDATDGVFPRITVWENVPGALSSNRGADFRTVLTALDDIGALGQWWYVLDAQYFGVPQRRRRVFVISVFDPSILNRTGHGPLLAVGQSRRRNPKKGRKPQSGIASTLGISPESPSGNETETVGALCARDFKGVGKQYVEEGKVVVQDDSHGDQLDFDPGVIGPLTSTGMSRARGTESVESNHVLVFTAQRVGDGEVFSVGEGRRGNPSTRDKTRQDPPANVARSIGFSHTQGLDPQPSEVATPTLRSNGSGMAVATNFDEYNFTGGNDIHHQIRAGTRQSTGVLQNAIVRRLTPTECERLMGWPDDHTLHRADGKTNSDSTRYKMCGNGVATPVAQWIATQLKEIL